MLELAKSRAIAESERFKQLGVVEAPTRTTAAVPVVEETVDRTLDSTERLVPVGQGRMRAGYSTRNRVAAGGMSEEEKKKQQQQEEPQFCCLLLGTRPCFEREE